MRQDEMLLNKAVQAMRATEPDAMQTARSAESVARGLGFEWSAEPQIDAIKSCEDVQRLLSAYRGGHLSAPRSLLIEAHLRDCSDCRHHNQVGSATAVNWSAPRPAREPVVRSRALGWAFAAAFGLAASGLFVYRAYWQVPPGVRAEVQSIDGAAYRTSEGTDRLLEPGDKLGEGEHVRTSGGGRAVLRLADGSTVEMNERSALGVAARGKNTTITLDDGALIVQAAKRNAGHLYVKTPDCRIAVTGTVFSVDSGIKGSRVAVLKGTVDVDHAGVDTLVAAGDQLSTGTNLSPAPVEQQIAWSHNQQQYLPLLAQMATLQHRIEGIPFPQPRYNSDLLTRVPASTLLYVSIPNLGDFLSQADQIFDEQLKQSPALEQWWNQGHEGNTAELDSMIEKAHAMSRYLGDEVVIVGVKQASTPGFAMMADITQPGLEDFLKSQLSSSSEKLKLTVLDAASLEAMQPSGQPGQQGLALVGQKQVIFSNSVAVLKLVSAQLASGDSGFATGDFGKQVASAYGRGAGILLAADLRQMVLSKASVSRSGIKQDQRLAESGFENLSYLIAEHREMNGRPENQVTLQFSGVRQGVASWLAAPAPMGSLDFITPNASIAVAMLSKDPKAIADDLMKMAAPNKAQSADWNDEESKLQINLRDDLAASLGGEFLVALDGPVLPTPSWKAVIEVNDSQHLEQTLERLATAISNQGGGKQAHSIAIQPSDVDNQRYYAVRDLGSGNTFAEYTFIGAYMIIGPSRAVVMEAVQTHANSNSLARSSAFRALLPKDVNDHYSAIAYQNLSPVLAPLLSELNGQAADALRSLAADARPTVICARGEQDRIEAASDSHLFGFDFVTLGTLMKAGNQKAAASVSE